MGHLKIIQISDKPVAKDEYIDCYDIQDSPEVSLRCDYFGEKLDRKEALPSIKEMMKGFADVNEKTGKVVFKDREEVKRMYAEHIRKVTDKALDRISDNACGFYDISSDLEEFQGIKSLFYKGDKGYAMTASYLIGEYLNGWIPQKVYIGGVLDGHY